MAEQDAQSKTSTRQQPLTKKTSKPKRPTDKLADKTLLTRILQGVFGDAQKKILKRMYKKALQIGALESKYEALSDSELQNQSNLLKSKLKNGTQKELDAILVDAFAIAREASKRILGMRPYDVQLIGGMVLHEGCVAEMKTGEGKTLVAMLPAYLNALTGKGVHVVTVNDYLAQRDAGWNAPVYHFLGLSVGVIVNQASFIYDPEYENEDHDDERFLHLKPATRKEAYAADITYGTNNEFGFDYLRDNMVSEPQYLRQRGLNFAIVDEVDSILIDEARTPLIISAPAGDNPDAYYQFAKVVSKLTPEDYVFDEKRRSVTLTDKGVEKIEKDFKTVGGFYWKVVVWFITSSKPCAPSSFSSETKIMSSPIAGMSSSSMSTLVVSCKVAATTKVSTKPLKLKKASPSNRNP